MKTRIVYAVVLGLLTLSGIVVVAGTAPSSAEASIASADNLSVERVSQAAKTNSIAQYGITWTFDAEYEYGQFANGDYWVLGPVTITRIEPDAMVDYHNLGGGICTGYSAGVSACKAAVAAQYPGYDARCDGAAVGTGNCIASYVQNGWEVNPRVAGPHGFQVGCNGGNLDASLVPPLPYTSPPTGTVSVVKTIPTGTSRPCIKVAAVLTIVTERPPDNGASVFRPPYVGTRKPYYYVADLRTDLLPSYKPVGSPPSLKYIEERFRRLRLDHKEGAIGGALRPADAMYDYQPTNSPDIIEGVLRFMIDTDEDIMPALIQYIQAGIDKVYTMLDGQTWPGGGGHQTAHLVHLAFTATMLDIQEAKDVLRNADFFHASQHLWSHTADGVHLWGENNPEAAYWAYIMTGSGSRSNRDPYGYIDGGEAGAAYQLITSQQHKGEVLAAELMPVLKEAWPATDLAYATNYADRWVNHGTWTQPDPCAPYDGNPNNYGITFGPDPNHPGMCILDPDLAYYNGPTDFACKPGRACGRYPEKHGTYRDGGQYRSAFVAAMWDAYRYASLLTLHATPANRAIHLNWQVNATLPPTSTWRVEYYTRTATLYTATNPFSITRSTVLTQNVYNYQWYTVTLHAMLGSTSFLSDTVRVMPTDRFVYLPLVLRK